MTVIPPAVSIPTLSAIDEQTIQEEVAEIGSLLDLPCSPESESDSDCKFLFLTPAVNSSLILILLI